MKLFLLTVFLGVTASQALYSQTINGQWRGFFNDNNNNIGLFGGNTEYVLELEINDETVSGTSYTYFENRRYYVICNLNGTYNKKTKRIVVNETERVKGATPPDWNDCLQTHILYYQKQEGKEVLTGEWKTSPYQEKKNGGCGYGATTLSRRVLTNTVAFNKQNRTNSVTRTKPKAPVVKKNMPSFKDQNKTTAPVVKSSPKTITPVTPPVTAKKDSPAKIEPPRAESPTIKVPEQKTVIADKPFEKRSANLIKSIEIEKETFRVDLYDNGDIDGDTISLFFNGKLLLAHKRLSDKAITLNLEVDKSKDINELVMYAENLGSIPPNTALMVVTDGDNRYEVRIASDLQKSGAIRFIHKPKQTQ
jgi:hypothetical protein